MLDCEELGRFLYRDDHLTPDGDVAPAALPTTDLLDPSREGLSLARLFHLTARTSALSRALAIPCRSPSAGRYYPLSGRYYPLYCQPNLLLGGISARICSPLYLENPTPDLLGFSRILERGFIPAPGGTRDERGQQGRERRRLDNLVDFVAEGSDSSGVRERLAATERKVSVLELEVAQLTRGDRAFPRPSLNWVEGALPSPARPA